MNPLPPTGTDWKVGGTWQMDQSFEPLGATDKRIRYTLDAARNYRLGLARVINGNVVRFTSDPMPGSAIGTPINGKIEIVQVIPITQRDLETWYFTD